MPALVEPVELVQLPPVARKQVSFYRLVMRMQMLVHPSPLMLGARARIVEGCRELRMGLKYSHKMTLRQCHLWAVCALGQQGVLHSSSGSQEQSLQVYRYIKSSRNLTF